MVMVLPLTLLSPPHLVPQADTTYLAARYIKSELAHTTPKAVFPDTTQRYEATVKAPCADAGGHLEAFVCVVPPPEPSVVETPPTPVYAPPAAVSVPANDGSAKMFIYMMESGNNPGAINASSGACGLGQALPCSKMGCSLSDYACQDEFFTAYCLSRYGSWDNAAAFWRSHRWW